MNIECRMSNIETRVTSSNRSGSPAGARHGMSLIEILIVVVVIAMLTTMVLTVASRIDTQARERSVESTFALLDGALQEYHEFTNRFPEQKEMNYANAVIHSQYLYSELQAVPAAQKILQKIDASLIKNVYSPAGVPLNQTGPEIYDPWGTALDYRYVAGDNWPRLMSAGPDKIFGTKDDMSNR
jgi:prepilin-type N-terminal cleavage/methylation domain-containing protein